MNNLLSDKNNEHKVLCDYDTNTIFLNGDIDEDTTYHVFQFLSKTFNTQPIGRWESAIPLLMIGEDIVPAVSDINVVINSNGGKLSDGLAIYDLLKSVPEFVNVRTVSLGNTMSSGAIIFCAGNERLIYHNSMILLHDLSGAIGGSYGEIVDGIGRFNQLMNASYNIIANTCNKSLSEVKQDMHRKDFFLMGQDSIDYGIATDYVYDVKLETKKGVEGEPKDTEKKATKRTTKKAGSKTNNQS